MRRGQPRWWQRRPARAAIIGAALLVTAAGVACSDDDSGSLSPTSTIERRGTGERSETEEVRWEVDELGDGLTVIDAGAFDLHVDTTDGLALSAFDGDRSIVADEAGLFVVRGDTRQAITESTVASAEGNQVVLDVTFADSTTGTVDLEAEGGHGLSVTVTPRDPEGVSAWGTSLALQAEELVYGLTERIVDDWVASEAIPEEVGSLDRRGEVVTMSIRPTMSGYVPFHQSSEGYGLLVDGMMPGRYDVGSTEAELTFEFEMDPSELAGTYHLLYGPDHARILEGYYDLTGHPARPPRAALRHWRGRDTNPVGEAGDYDGQSMNALVASDLAAYERYDIPAGVYHFDRPWAVGQEGFGEFRFDLARYPEAEGMLEMLDGLGWSSTVWMAPWALDARGEEAKANGWLAPNSERAIDLTDPDAVEWLQDDLTEFLQSDEGQFVDGFFLDRGDEPDVTSTADDIYADGRNGRQIHNWYPVEYARIFKEVMQRERGDDGWLITRAGYTGSQRNTTRWGGDTRSREVIALIAEDMAPNGASADAPSTDLGLRSVLISIQRAAFMGTPFWGSDIGGYSPWIDREVFARWIQVGFASPLMRFHGMGGTPWATTTTGQPDAELIDIYRRYIDLRQDPVLLDYLDAAADEAAESGTPMVRPMVWEWPEEPNALDMWDQWMLGDDLLVAPVWRSGVPRRKVWIPPGEWIDFWDRDTTVEGPRWVEVEVPLDMLPMWVRPDSPLLDLAVPA